jgi:predicted nucleic acid-binding Zn ribbon protein
LSDALAAFVAANPQLGARLDAATVVDRWADAVGPQIAAISRALRVTPDGGLVVEVSTHGWMQELSMMERDLLSRLAATPGGPPTEGVRKLIWVLARK